MTHDELMESVFERLHGSGLSPVFVQAGKKGFVAVTAQGVDILIAIYTGTATLSVKALERRIHVWKESIHGFYFRSIVVLCSRAKFVPDILKAAPGLPLGVVGEWRSRDSLAVQGVSDGMRDVLFALGVPPSQLSRIDEPRNSTDTEYGNHSAPDTPRSLMSPSQPARRLARGMQLDAYRLEQRLGSGFSAQVWRALVQQDIPGVDLRVGDAVAIKIYNLSLLQGFEALRIQREFGIASELSHDNLARVYDLVLSPSRPFHTFMVMEYVPGPTLKAFIEDSKGVEDRLLLEIASQLFGALAELHSLDAIHRDVKAANIIVASSGTSPFQIKLVDLGIVSVAQDAHFTAASVFLGSKHSAPLEQLEGAEVDVRADIYGAGSVLYHCITRRPMYYGVGPEGAIVRRMLSKPEQLRILPGLDGQMGALYRFVNDCIAVQADDRPGSAEECLERVRHIRTIK